MRILILGGTGFIGAHFARHVLERDPDSSVVLADRVPLDEARFAPAIRAVLRPPRCRFEQIDVRQPFPESLASRPFDLVVNFAAVHREPGHDAREYWETNLLGAENTIAFAEAIGCRRIIFTSSISPYGLSDDARDEKSLPVPATAYGGSKLAAEKIHQAWQRGAPDRLLLIVRPGVVFGPGEGGNVSRMIRFLRKGLFFYLGNRQVRKAGLFVKELVAMIDWAWDRLEQDPDWGNLRRGVALFNASFAPPPSLEEYVAAIRTVGDFRRPVFSIPFRLLYAVSHLGFGIAGIHPVRVRKLVRPNLILPSFLVERAYPYRWSLEQAMQDWKAEKPDDWN